MTLHGGEGNIQIEESDLYGYDNPAIVREITDAIWTGFRSLFSLIESSHLGPGEAELATSCFHFTLKYYKAPCNIDEAAQLAQAFADEDETQILQLMPAWGRGMFEILGRNNARNGLKLEAFMRTWVRDMKNWERRNTTEDSRRKFNQFRRNKADDDDIEDAKDKENESAREI